MEAAAYFVVSECLANIGKHAEAKTATVSVTADDGRLTVVVTDDGVGGASLDSGSGIQGLADRVGALSGSLARREPAGRGHPRDRASIPLTARRPREEARPVLRAARVLSAAEAEARQAERRTTSIRAAVAWHRRGRARGDLGADRPRPALDRVAAAGHRPDRGARRVARLSMPPLSDADLAGAPDRDAALARARARAAACATTRAGWRSSTSS